MVKKGARHLKIWLYLLGPHLSHESGKKLSDIQMVHFGTSKFVESTKNSTIFVGGSADVESIETKIESFKSDIERTEDLEACDSIQKRNRPSRIRCRSYQSGRLNGGRDDERNIELRTLWKLFGPHKIRASYPEVARRS